MNTLLHVYLVLVPLAEKAPEPEDVKQGWLGFAVFLALAFALVLLWFSLRKHLRRVTFEEGPDRPRRTSARRDGDAPSDGTPQA